MALLRDIAYGFTLAAMSPVLAWKAATTGKYRRDWAGRLGHTGIEPQDRPTVLLHAVSVGEVNALRGLVDELHQRHADRVRLVISTTTDTGIDRARDLFAAEHDVVRFPLDFTRCVNRFLDQVNPTVAVMVELEVWPNFATVCRHRGVPLVVVNGRLSERSFRGYRRVRRIVRSMFRSLSAAAVQDQAYADRFAALGTPADRIEVTGTMKWDNAVLTDHIEGSDALRTALGIDPGRPLIVCGSTGPGEEQMFRDALEQVNDARGRAVQVLMAPRKPERFDEAAAVLGKPIRRSEHPDDQPAAMDDHRWFLLDTIGDLKRAYALADVVIVGRSFCPLFGSDLAEPIALGKPTIIGPNTSDFADMVRKFLAGRGVIQLSGIKPLAEVVQGLLEDPAGAAKLAERGRAVIRKNQGATRRHADLIERFIQPLGPGQRPRGVNHEATKPRSHENEE